METKQRQLNIIRTMFKSGMHSGHAIKEMHYKMKPYLFTHKQGRHVIDIGYTFRLLFKTVQFVGEVAHEGGQFLFIGTNPRKSDYITVYAQKAQCHFVTYKWLGGMLTNWKTIKNRILLLHRLESQILSNHFIKLPKKEASILNQKLSKLRKFLNGLKYMLDLPDVVIILEQQREHTAIAECQKLAIPVICIVDTNCDPTIVDLPIPANDDNVFSVKYVLEVLTLAIIRERKHNLLKTQTQS